jgi:phage protein D
VIPIYRPGDDLNPIWNIEINGQDIGENIAKFVKHIEYESADGITDVARVRLANPDNLVTDSKTFQPGNEMTIYAGYAYSVEPLGTVKIIRQRPNYPQNAEPTVLAEGYTRDSDFMEHEPEKSKKKKGKGGRTFKSATYADIVRWRVQDYGMALDIDPTNDVIKSVIQKAGMNDYKFLKGIANIVGYVMWVDKVPALFGPPKWTFHFKHPAALAQNKKIDFKYNYYDDTNLLSFQPELLIKGTKTNIVVTVKDRETGAVLKAEINEKYENGPDLDASNDLAGEVVGEYTTSSDIVLAFGGFAFDVISNRRFTAKAEVKAWAEQWYRRMRDNFILSRGITIGDNTLSARQTHSIDGVGNAYNGDYYFSKVKHVLGDNGYLCEFGARKVLP